MENIESAREDKNLKEKKTEEQENISNTKKAASFWQLQYTFSKGFKDAFIVTVAIIGSIGMGLSMPLFSIVFGGTVNSFGSTAGPFNREAFIEDIRKMALNFLYVGLGIFASGFMMIWLWSLNGKTTAKRIKKEYLKLLMRQEQAFFDLVKPFEFATKIQSQVKTIEMGVS